MSGLTVAESQATLDERFPTSGATDLIGWSIDGTSEFTGLARTPVGDAGWAAATPADPAVKANAVALTSAAATAGGAVGYFAVFSGSGTQRTDWTALAAAKTLQVGDKLTAAVGAIKVTLT